MMPFKVYALLLVSFFLVSNVRAQSVPHKSNPVTADSTVPISTVLDQIKEALVLVQKDLANKKLPPLASIDLTLKTVAEKDVGGTLKLFILTLGAKREKDQTQTVTIHLNPPSASNPKNIAASPLTLDLEHTIVSAAEGAQQSEDSGFPLIFSGLTVELEVTIKMSGTAGAKIPVILPITPELTGQVSKNATQTIKIVFQDRKAESPAKP
jgi:hypothetical protein